MLRKTICCCFFVLSFYAVFAQKEAYNWYFGKNAALNFNTSPPTPMAGSAMVAFEGCAAISDANGQLLFYTNGISVWNKNNQLMPHGNQTLLANPSSTQAAIVVPQPGSNTIYFVFTTDALGGNGFCYDVVDMSLDGGLGDVDPARHTNLLISGPEKVTAVGYCNGTGSYDYWVITHSDFDVFLAYSLTSAGLNTTPVQSTVGLTHNNPYGYLKASPDGSKLGVAMHNPNTKIGSFEVFDFNTANGDVSNQILLCDTCKSSYGIEFSPNNKLIYTTGIDWEKYIYQYDLSAGTPANVIASVQNIALGQVPASVELGALQIGPDNKIYVAEFNGFGGPSSDYLGIIDSPNTIGSNCNYSSNAINIGSVGTSFLGLPNFNTKYFSLSLSNPTICSGDIVTIGPNAPAATSTYTWSPTTGFINGSTATTPTPTVSPTSTTTYTVNVTDAGSCTGSAQLVVTVFSTPTVDAGIDQTICAGSSIGIGSATQANSTYTWSPSTGLNNAAVANPTASPTSTTTYSVTITNAGSCIATDQTIITVKNVPIANAGLDTTICSPGQVKLRPTMNGSYTYQWAPAASLNNPNIAQPIATVSTTTTFYLTVTDNGCTDSDMVVINVATPLANAGSDVTICSGRNISIGTAAQAGYTYLWSPATGLNSTTGAMPNASPTITTTYTVSATSPGNCTATDDVVVNVLSNIPVDAGNDTAICAAGQVMLHPLLNNNYTYLWAPAAGLNNANIAQPTTVTLTTTTTYYLTVSENGCTNSDSVIIHVSPLSTANAGIDKTICNGNNTSLGTPAVAGYVYSWAPGTGLSTTTGASPTASPSSTTTYSLTVTDSNTGCSASSSAVVTVNQLPQASAGRDTSICNGNSVNIGMPVQAGISYLWSPAIGLSKTDTSTTIASPSATTTYTLTATDVNTLCQNTAQIIVSVTFPPQADAGPDQVICAGSSATLGGNNDPLAIYTWNPTQSLNNSAAPNPLATPSANTTYTVTVTNANGCSLTDEVVINIALQDVSLAPVFNLCKGDSILLNTNGNPTYTYDWQPVNGLNNSHSFSPSASPSATTSYSVTITQQLQGTTTCSVVKNTVVNVSAIQLFLGNPRNIIACEHDPISLSLHSNEQGSHFLFSSKNNFSDTLNASSFDSTYSFVPAKTTATYFVMTYNQFCKSIDSISYLADTIRVNAIPITTCGEKTETINVIQTTVAPLRFKWKNDTTIIGADTLPQLTIKTSSSNTYFAIVSNQRGCTSILAAPVMMGTRIKANITADKYDMTKEESVTLQASPAGSFNFQYQWISSAGEISTSKNNALTVAPKKTTTYYLEITDLQDPQTCIGRDTVVINIHALISCDPKLIYIPNAFTPNGDGNNDVLYIRSNSIKDVELLIFNRWGEKIKEIHSMSDGWDGTYHEQECPRGVYVYYLRYTCNIDGERYLKTGNITLIR